MKRRGLKRAKRYNTISLGYGIEQLEQRQLLAWTPIGPFSATNGQVENIAPDEDVVGAAHVVLAHPSDADTLYVGGTNGGIWKTENATATRPDWVPVGDNLPSLSIGAMTFDTADTTNQTVYAATGRFSSYGRIGGDRIGIVRTTDGGASWEVVDGGGVLQGKNISAIAVNGDNIVVSVNTADTFSTPNIGIFRSTDGGNTFQQVSVGDGSSTGLPSGVSYDLFADPTNPDIIYTAMAFSDATGGGQVGVYRTTNGGAAWTKVSDATIDALIDNGTDQRTGTSNLEIAVGRANNVYVSIINSGHVVGLFRSGDGGANWTQMDTPQTNENGTLVDLNPKGGKGPKPGSPPEELAGGQGSIHFSMVADPTDPNIVYVGGDRQPLEFQNPTSIGATDYTGRLFRGDASQASGSQWVHLTHSNTLGASGGGTASGSAPHADSREMVFDAAGNIIEADDGGIYRRTQPRSNQGDWFSVNGNLQITEVHDVAYDAVSGIAYVGNQDTGTMQQVVGQSLWYSITTGDGGDVIVDDVSLADQGQSILYSSFTNLGGFARRTYDTAGNLVGLVAPALTLNSGTPFQGVFRTPMELNVVNPFRLAIQGASGFYESLDQGDSIDEVTVAGASSAANGDLNQNAIVAGGYSGGVASENVLWVGSDDRVLFRDDVGTQLVETNSPGLGTIRDLAVDTDEWRSVFVIDSTGVAMSGDAGTSWQDITGDLLNYASSLWSVSYVAGSVMDALVVGTNAGVFMSYVDSLGTWTELSTGMPNAIVDDMEYDIATDSLVAGTLGRGVWMLPNASAVIQGIDENDNNNNNNGNGSNSIVDACGVPLPDGTVSFSGAIGGNLYASNHAILDGSQPGMQGYDNVVLDFLRGKGTESEIAKSNYSIAVIGNGLSDWSFSDGGHSAPGYERTDFYNINYITTSVFDELISHDLVIVLSGEDAVTDGLSSSEMALWATVETDLAEAVNSRGLDLWVGASGGNSSYYDFLPTGVLSTSTFSTEDPLDGYEVTLEGSLLGITDAMVDSAPAEGYFDNFDNDLFGLEYRELGEITAVAGQAIAFYNDELVAAKDVPGGTSVGMDGLAFQDLNMDGVQDGNEFGVGGARFFIDYNGDGIIGLCEPTATADALGRFHLRSGYAGHFQILPVPTAGIYLTSTNPVYIDLASDGTATLSAPLSFGVIVGADTGGSGDGSTPIAPGAYLGTNPIKDDGVIFSHGIQKGTNTVTIISSVTHRNTVMNAWIDLNKDGDWNDPGERIFTNVVLQPGQHDYTFNIPTTVFDDSILPQLARLAASVRFRVGPTLDVGPEANDSFGEIEDYKVYLSQGPDAGLTANNDVFEYQEDTDGQFFNVLANDSSFYNRALSIVPGSVTNISPVTTPPLDITVSPDGTRILFNADGVADLTENITFQYTVQDSVGNTQTATVTLVAPLDPNEVPTGNGSGTTASLFAFHNANGPVGDVDNDGSLTGLDLVKIIKQMQKTGSIDLPEWSYQSPSFSTYVDVNSDGRFSYLDLLAFVDALTHSKWEAEGLELEPAAAVEVSTVASNTVVDVLAAPQIVNVVAPITTQETFSAAVGVTPLYAGWQAATSKPSISSLENGNQAESSLVVDEAFSDAGLGYVDDQQEDLLLAVDTGSDEFAAESSRVEDEIFGDEQWDEELLAF
ncbi:hypothetical protein DTL42_20125 [Bremerella cremea]|uniref:GEVED domain-containing protein n=1 Tax=Bremerella cremea TaxID=1031537 RepID=A0A368KQC4_9BACT|nr:GEVED domain-containing protein [Bremerella cremea]RCS42140.1 hypothetical protein DTL42_20125 [Bremerella cremea]